jgi:hypothetical protein
VRVAALWVMVVLPDVQVCATADDAAKNMTAIIIKYFILFFIILIIILI